jgi:hypothetical protein
MERIISNNSVCCRVKKAQTQNVSRRALQCSDQIDITGFIMALTATNRRIYTNDNGIKIFHALARRFTGGYAVCHTDRTKQFLLEHSHGVWLACHW